MLNNNVMGGLKIPGFAVTNFGAPAPKPRDKNWSTPPNPRDKNWSTPPKVKKMKMLKHPVMQLYDVLSYFVEFC